MENMDQKTISSLTENALRHLSDYTYLGNHDLAELMVVRNFVTGTPSAGSKPLGNGDEEAVVTHLARGKALYNLLVYSIDQLRPPGNEPAPAVVPPREWHHYVILHDSYVEGKLTRDIMARLYIGEGTYGRARRRALNSVGKVIQEMEQQSTHSMTEGMGQTVSQGIG